MSTLTLSETLFHDGFGAAPASNGRKHVYDLDTGEILVTGDAAAVWAWWHELDRFCEDCGAALASECTCDEREAV